MRFDKRLRSVCSLMYSASAIMLMPIVIYVPALAFNQVTGVNIHVVSPIVCLVCIFYTLVVSTYDRYCLFEVLCNSTENNLRDEINA